MSSADRETAPSYHHGDLRAALVRSALELIGEGDLAQLSLRKVAARAGVSSAAPYHHFAHKNDLLSAVAAHAFEQLRGRLEEAIAGKRSPVRRFEAAAHAYLDFAVENPSRFRVMSLPELAYVETPDGRAKLEAAQASFALLVRLVTEAGPAARSQAELKALTVTVYAAVLGFARLCIDGSLGLDEAQRGPVERRVVANLATLAAGR